jgi:hypothetical protein
MLLHWDGAAWTEISAGTSASLRGIWGSAPDDVWAVGNTAAIIHLGHRLPAAHGGRCERPISASCNHTVHGATYGTPDRLDAYPCAAGNLSGGEVYYRLDNPVSGTLTVTLTSREADLDLIVLGSDTSRGCDPDGACLASSQGAGAGGVEQVILEALQGETLYLVVDAPAGQAGAFTLSIGCHKHL